MRGDIVVLATPEIAGLPYVISGLVAAGGMAAAMSTADGLLLAIANALSHDLYYKIIDPEADTRTRLIVARILLIIIGAGGALVASLQLSSILGAVAWDCGHGNRLLSRLLVSLPCPFRRRHAMARP